jgi:flavin-dependent dehydrogenase
LSKNFDVVICGGGLAGLTLARQLKLELPQVSVALVDRLARPLPEAAFKVGESSIELATHYFGQVLQLGDYFERCHLFKLGLRFFFGDGHQPIEERPETGPDMFPPIPSYQIDRGRLENDLRQIVLEMGIELFEGALVEDVLLSKNDQSHVVKCRWKAGGAGFLLASRWLVDAMGRRRLLQTKLGLALATEHQASSAWWRYSSRIDVDKIGAAGGRKWRLNQVEPRLFSTCHLMGPGYWVWLIPLVSGGSSVGIVTDETIFPQKSYGRSYAQAMDWLHDHEPVLWESLSRLQPMDFHSLKNYSYGSQQVFSSQRWSCVGEAGFFLDPLYSLGSDFIAIGNTLTVEMIRRDLAGLLAEADVQAFNQLVLEQLLPLCLDFYRGMYPIFGHAQVFTAKFFWDTALYWAWMAQLFFQDAIRLPTPELLALGERYCSLNARMQGLFLDWSKAAPPRQLFLRADMTRMRFWQLLHLDLAARRTPSQLLEIARKNLDRFEELAQVLFWQAVEECYPENPILYRPPWIDAWRICLDPASWSSEGLFEPASSPRPLRLMRADFTGIFAPQSLPEFLIYEIPYRFLHWGQGFPYYRLVPLILRSVVTDKPAMSARRWLIRDHPSRP